MIDAQGQCVVRTSALYICIQHFHFRVIGQNSSRDATKI